MIATIFWIGLLAVAFAIFWHHAEKDAAFWKRSSEDWQEIARTWHNRARKAEKRRKR